MHRLRVCWLLPVVALAGCIAIEAEAFTFNSSKMGSVALSVSGPEGTAVDHAGIFLDDEFIGTVSGAKHILHLKRGEHTIRVRASGCKDYERELRVLGGSNPQVLNFALEPE